MGGRRTAILLTAGCCVGLVLVLILMLATGHHIPFTEAPNDHLPHSAIRHQLRDKTSVHVPLSKSEIAARERAEREGFFVSVTCAHNQDVHYTREEARLASQVGLIPTDKLIATKLKANDDKHPSPLEKGSSNKREEGATTKKGLVVNAKRTIVVIHKWVLDVTDFVAFHPGGKMLLEGVGKADSGGLFMQHHGPTSAVLMSDFCIGVVSDEVHTPKK